MKSKTFGFIRHFRIFLSVFFLLPTAVMFTACGKKGAEPVNTQLGIDGYVYQPKQLKETDIRDITVFGDYLYYYGNSGIYRAALVPEENTENASSVPDFSTKKKLISSASSFIPDKMENYPQKSEEPVYNDMRQRILDTGKDRYSFFLSQYYTVDKAQNFYYYIVANAGNDVVTDYGGIQMDMEPIGGMLYKQTAEGEIVYRLFLPSLYGLAADAEERLYALTDQGICVLDASGRQISVINIDSYIDQSSEYTSAGTLLSGSAGPVYYVTRSNLGFAATIWEISGSDSFRLQEIPALTNKYITNISASPNGSLMFFDTDMSKVYEYDRESSQINEILRWEDANCYGDNFRKVVRLSPDRLLAEYWGNNEQNIYLLSKISVDQLPKKELVVLASLSPSSEIRNAVISFNRQSSEYHVVVETYGSDLSGEDREPRLDATLVSSAPPDLLDLHNIYKYADQGALEDLTPYLEASSEVPLDDYLESVIKGYTINDRLICVPTQFSISLIVGRESQLEAMGLKGGWTMEDAYALTERYPDSIILHSLTNSGSPEKQEALRFFCSTWFLEKFVDWEAGTCSFDSDGFRQMVLWLDKYSGTYTEPFKDPATGIRFVDRVFMPEDALLTQEPFTNFKTDLVFLEYQFQENIRILGVPTADGRNKGRIYVHDALSITSNARNKEGAWAFLEYFLSKIKSQSVLNSYFPTRKSQLEAMFSSAVTPPPKDPYTGQYQPSGSTRYYYGIGESIPYYYTPERLAQELMTAIEASDFSPLPDEADKILNIVLEEMESYYNNSKTLEAVTEIIQNRVQLLLDERRK